MNGHELHARLRDEFHIEMEMEAENYVLGIAAVGDTEEGFERLCSAIEKIDAETETETDAGQERTSYAKMKQVLSIAQAMDAQQRRFPLEESAGDSHPGARRADLWTFGKKCEKIHGTGSGSAGAQ